MLLHSSSIFVKPLTTRASQFPGGIASSGLPLSIRDGTNVRSCVYAIDHAGEASQPICSERLTYDATPPLVEAAGFAVIDNGGNRFLIVPNETICSSWPPFDDATSGVSHVQWELVRRLGGQDVVTGAAVDLGVAAAVGGSRCRVLDAQTLKQGGRYFTRLRIKNGASPPLVALPRSRGFIVDRTSPTTGRISVSLRYPPRFERQASFPYNITGLNLRVVLDGFSDDDSGLALVDLIVFADGVELMRGTAVPTSAHELIWMNPTSFGVIQNGTNFTVSAVAINRVGLRGDEASSTPNSDTRCNCA